MTRDQHRAVVAAHRAMKGKATPAEYMAYMWSRQSLGETLTAGQRGFLAAAQKPHWHGEPVENSTPDAIAPARAFAQPAQPADVPAWVIEDRQETQA